MKQKGYARYRLVLGFAPLLIILIIAILGAGGFLGYKYVLKSNSQKTIIPTPYPIETIDPTVNWKTYTNPGVGFSFKYPPDITFNTQLLPKQNETNLFMSITRISSLTDDYPGTNKSYVDEDQPKLLRGEYGLDVGMGKNHLNKVVNMGGVYMKSYVIFTGLECGEVHFYRGLLFYKGDYVIEISLAGPEDLIVSENPKYFIVDKENCGLDTKIWNSKENMVYTFTQDLSKGNVSETAKNWYRTFDQILSTFKFTE